MIRTLHLDLGGFWVCAPSAGQPTSVLSMTGVGLAGRFVRPLLTPAGAALILCGVIGATSAFAAAGFSVASLPTISHVHFMDVPTTRGIAVDPVAVQMELIRTESNRLFLAAKLIRTMATRPASQGRLAAMSAASRTAGDAAQRVRTATDQLIT